MLQHAPSQHPAWALTPPPSLWRVAPRARSHLSPRRRQPLLAEQAPALTDGRVAKLHAGTDPAEVELRDVHVSFNGKSVLKGLNLRVRRGEATAIIGTSGTGKSTTLRVITGLEVPDSGEVFVHGWRRTDSVAREKGPSRVSMVFQNAALFDSLTVAQNVAFSLLREGSLSDDRILELVEMFLKRVDLEDAIDKYPEELSGGMRKRVSVARAIIHDPDKPETAPDLLLYDEPTAGLDPTASTRIENIIRSLQDVCPTCVVVTHQFSTIRRTADRVVLMHEGAVAWDGPVEELETTDNPYVRQFMSAALDGPLSSEDNHVE